MLFVSVGTEGGGAGGVDGALRCFATSDDAVILHLKRFLLFPVFVFNLKGNTVMLVHFNAL